MQFILFILTIHFVSFSFADTFGILNDERALVIVQGNDSDAKTLFDALAVIPTESNGTLTKDYKFSHNENPIFSILCKWSHLTNSGSCTVTLNKWISYPVNCFIDAKKNNYALLETVDKYVAEGILKNFVSASGNHIFSSENSRLRIWAFKDHLGKATKFAIQYDHI